MTKVQLHYELTKPLDDRLLEQIARAHSLFGMQRVQLTPQMDGLVVDYDASRLTLAQVEAALLGAGLPVQRRAHA